MSDLGFFFDVGNIGLTCGATIIYVHWTTLVAAIALPTLVGGVALWFLWKRRPNDPRP